MIVTVSASSLCGWGCAFRGVCVPCIYSRARLLSPQAIQSSVVVSLGIRVTSVKRNKLPLSILCYVTANLPTHLCVTSRAQCFKWPMWQNVKGTSNPSKTGCDQWGGRNQPQKKPTHPGLLGDCIFVMESSTGYSEVVLGHPKQPPNFHTRFYMPYFPPLHIALM